MIEDLLRREFYHNRISEYLLCLAIIVGGILAVRVVAALALRRLKAWAGKSSSTWDDFLVDRIPRIGMPLAYTTTRDAWKYSRRPTCGSTRSSRSAGSSSPTRPRPCTFPADPPVPIVRAEARIFTNGTRFRIFPPRWWNASIIASVPCPSASGAMR
jgi:hypothetical protein